ncbi:hypothetical protein ADUPG1_000631 [Aduncisulcus paluster]|uniref:Uncharacterized protein n=1 Tax=Aduncisulcus paluster TaxID=2918883 RepID=A0ABQ5KAP2_9EUKA|nr:hypothetical protein ADUPG1_000631 [Aduncisulcus paluster]
MHTQDAHLLEEYERHGAPTTHDAAIMEKSHIVSRNLFDNNCNFQGNYMEVIAKKACSTLIMNSLGVTMKATRVRFTDLRKTPLFVVISEDDEMTQWSYFNACHTPQYKLEDCPYSQGKTSRRNFGVRIEIRHSTQVQTSIKLLIH